MRIDTFNLTVSFPSYSGKKRKYFTNISRTAVKRYETMYADEWPKAVFTLEKVPAWSSGHPYFDVTA